jgi:NitT/TauT family transport system permease protein
MNHAVAVFSPNAVLNKNAMRVLIATQVAIVLLLWIFSPFVLLPKPGEVLSAFGDLWEQGLGAELITSFYLNLEAIAWATVVSLLLAYATVMPFFRPIVALLSKLRFLSLVGLTFFFTLMAKSGHELKLSLLVFSVSVFFVTGMADVINGIPKEMFDLARTLRMGEWRVVWEVIVLGQIDKVFDVLRQNAAIGWMMLTMVEGIVRSEGGVGTVLLDQNHHFRLAAVFAIQLTILMLGLFQDYGIGLAKNLLPVRGTDTGAEIMATPYSLGKTLLKIDNVCLEYDGRPVLSNVTAEVRDIIVPGRVQGQVVGILGPSGCGKTSSFRIIAGLNAPTSGRVSVNGFDRPVQAGEVGVVAQSYPLFEHRTVLGNLMLARRRRKRTPSVARDKVMELLKEFELEDKYNLYPAQLSGGQRQRCAIIQQILCSEHFLLMDEPFSGLDLIMLEKTCELITKVSDMDDLNTIIVVTHDVTAACSVADHLWLMGRDSDEHGNTSRLPNREAVQFD